MGKCIHEIRETKRGAGPCRIEAEVKLRNGKPNWWCRTHGMAASTPDGSPLEECPGAWLPPLDDGMLLALDIADGEIAIWGAIPPAIAIGQVDDEPGKIHVHRRRRADAPKDLDRSYDLVTIVNGTAEIVIEGMAAVAYSVSELAGKPIVSLRCPHCGETHIDELRFATYPHSKHLCNSCGRNFRDKNPSISNPLADANKQLGLPPRPEPVRSDLPLLIAKADYAGIALFPSNAAIVTSMSRPEEKGIHVHAWDLAGKMVLDETYSSVEIDGEMVDEDLLRILAVQRALAHSAPVISKRCTACGEDLCDSLDAFMDPVTRHICGSCGATTKTRLRTFVNPLVDLLSDQKPDV